MPLLVVSSRFLSPVGTEIDDRVTEVLDLTPGAIEIGHPCEAGEIREFVVAASSSRRRVTALHAAALLTSRTSQLARTRPAPNPASIDRSEIEAATGEIRTALECAARVEIPRVVVRTRWMGEPFGRDELVALARDDQSARLSGSDGLRAAIEDAAKFTNRRRETHARLARDGLRRYLEAALDAADAFDVELALRVPATDFGVPNGDEFDSLVQEFAGSGLRARFELGAAELLTRCGLGDFDARVTSLRPHLGGVRLSATDLEEGTLLFGTGVDPDRDSERLARVAGDLPVHELEWVIDPAPKCEREEVESAIEHALELGCEEAPPEEADPFPRIG